MPLRHRAGFAAAAAIVAAPATAAAMQALAFDIRPQPLAPAVVQFALQAGISVDAEAAAACRPTRGVRGRLAVETGLRRLLAGTGCGYRMVDARTVVIVRRAERLPARPRPAPSARPAAPADPGPAEVAELIVTSPKRTVGLARAPFAVSAVSGQSLVEAGIADTSNLAGRIAGMTVTNLGPGRNKVFLRGMADAATTGRTQAVVGIYLDEARIIYNAPDPELRLTDIERVEVLRGPQGSLYGSGSIGGVMQIVTRAPRLDALEGFASTAATVTAHGAAGNVIEAAINAPIVRDRLALRLTGYREEAGGYIDDPARGLFDVDGVVRQGVRASALWQVTEAWRVRATWLDQTIRAADSHYAEPGDPYSRSLEIGEPHRNDFDGLTTVVEGDLDWARLKVANALQRHEFDSRQDAGLSLSLFDPAAVGPAAYDEANRVEAIVTEATLTSHAAAPLSWLAGVFVSEYSQDLEARLTGSTSPLYAETRGDHVDEYALYGEATLALGERLRLTAGGRFYRLGVETDAEVSEPGRGLSNAFSGETSEHGFAPKLLAEYDLSPRVLLYALMSEGYRSGGFNTAGLVGQVFSIPGEGAQPYRRFGTDELVSYEAGARLSLFDDSLRLRLAVFRAEWSDIQSDRLLPSGLPFTGNIGDAGNTGIEVEAAYRRGGLTLDGALFLNDPELTRQDPGFPIPVDRHLPGVASVLANAGVRYEWEAREGLAAVAGADLGYVGKSTLTFDAAVAPRMGGYLTSRLHAGLSGARWRVFAYVDNPLGEAGDTFAYGNPFRLRLREQRTPQRPRTFSLGLSRGF